MTPASLISMAGRIGVNAATLVERMMRERPHLEQGYRSAIGIIALARRYQRDRLEAACERALVINAIDYSSVSAIPKSGLDRMSPAAEPIKATPLSRQHPWRDLLSMKERNIVMLTHPTLDQMQTLGLAGMAAAYRQLVDSTMAPISAGLSGSA